MKCFYINLMFLVDYVVFTSEKVFMVQDDF